MAKINLLVGGAPGILANMKAHQVGLGVKLAAGLRVAGLLLQRESQLKVPVEFGVLKASAYTRETGSGFSTEVEVGYTAAYALYVHELVGMKLKGIPRSPNPPHKGKYWDPQGRASAKFLEEPARRLTPQMRAIVVSMLKLP